MQKNIVLQDTDIAGPASVQLQRLGKDIGDSWYRNNSTKIFDEFKIHANSHYRLVCEEELDEEEECGLCAHDIRYGCEIRATTLLTTHHPDLDTSITWPEHMTLGSTCIKMLGIDSYVTRFAKSCFKDFHNPTLKMTDNGKVKIWPMLAGADYWKSRYKYLVLPHSVFNMVPMELMNKAGIGITVLRSIFDPKRKLEATLYRSFNSRHGKWRERRIVFPQECFYKEDALNYDLATVITREDAKKICEIYKKG